MPPNKVVLRAHFHVFVIYFYLLRVKTLHITKYTTPTFAQVLVEYYEKGISIPKGNFCTTWPGLRLPNFEKNQPNVF